MRGMEGAKLCDGGAKLWLDGAKLRAGDGAYWTRGGAVRTGATLRGSARMRSAALGRGA